MELEDILDMLHRGEIITEPLALEIRERAKVLGDSIYANFNILKRIVEQHETTIRKRWVKKSRRQREDVLDKAWPNMPQAHRPDFDLYFQHIMTNISSISKVSLKLRGDAIYWPYINKEALVNPQALLIFLIARSRNLPWTFAESEMEFSPFGQLPDCLGRSKETVSMHHCFTKDIDSGSYGAAIILEDYGEHQTNISDESFEYCQRQGLQLLHVQERIYSFLVKCTKEILHNMTDEELMNDRNNKELKIGRAVAQHDIECATFADAIMLAPYRARSKIDFSRLRSYVAALLNDAKDHLWSLREDPSYLRDVIKDTQNHQLDLVRDSKGRISPLAYSSASIVRVVREVIQEAYVMLASWHVLFQKLDKLAKLCKDGIVYDIHAHLHAIMAIKGLASRIRSLLTQNLRLDSWTAPKMRHLYVRQNDQGQSDIPIKEGVPPKKLEVVQLMTILMYFDPRQPSEPSDRMLCLQLDKIDDITRKHRDIKHMLSLRISKTLTELSVIAECLRQVSLWVATPEVQLFQEGHQNCTHRLEDDGWTNFMHWNQVLESYTPLIHLVNPSRHKLNYSVYGANRKLDAMRTAEMNLDKFWHDVDSYFANVTNIKQHEIIWRYLQGEMQRTPPPPESGVHDNLEPVYVPLSRIFHDASKQITGAFDRATIFGKVKTKTRGVTTRVPTVPEGRERDDEDEGGNSDPGPQLLHLEKRAYKVFKTLFGMHTLNPGDVPKLVKWDDFTRAMMKAGFFVEKLQGSAWQFTPVGENIDVERSIQFHEPHPDNDIPYNMARRFGRRLERVYGWTSDTFTLA